MGDQCLWYKRKYNYFISANYFIQKKKKKKKKKLLETKEEI